MMTNDQPLTLEQELEAEGIPIRVEDRVLMRSVVAGRIRNLDFTVDFNEAKSANMKHAP